MKHTFRRGKVEMKDGVVPRNVLVIPIMASDPPNPVVGQVWLNSTDLKLKFRISDTFTYETDPLV